jgi:hypothetical protein
VSGVCFPDNSVCCCGLVTCCMSVADVAFLHVLFLPLYRATDTDTTDEILAAAIEHAKRMRYCAKVGGRPGPKRAGRHASSRLACTDRCYMKGDHATDMAMLALT